MAHPIMTIKKANKFMHMAGTNTLNKILLNLPIHFPVQGQ